MSRIGGPDQQGKAARFDPLQAQDRLHGVQLANQIATLVIVQLFIS